MMPSLSPVSPFFYLFFCLVLWVSVFFGMMGIVMDMDMVMFWALNAAMTDFVRRPWVMGDASSPSFPSPPVISCFQCLMYDDDSTRWGSNPIVSFSLFSFCLVVGKKSEALTPLFLWKCWWRKTHEAPTPLFPFGRRNCFLLRLGMVAEAPVLRGMLHPRSFFPLQWETLLEELFFFFFFFFFNLTVLFSCTLLSWFTERNV